MLDFQSQFMKSKGKPIVHQGNTLVMMDDFSTEWTRVFRLVFEICNGEWRQGVSLRVRDKGTMVMNDQNVKHAICWRDTAPEVVEFHIEGKVSFIEIKNVWDVGDGVIHSWHNCAAMIVEELPNGRRYRCNDGYADDDFDDIVFRVERVSEP